MARNKVKLVYIVKNSARKATYKKRIKGLMKKMHELSTLCGIDACAIVYNPFTSRPQVWPSQSEVDNILDKFKNISVTEQSKKMLDQETYLTGMIFKASGQLKKVRMQNCEKELNVAIYQTLTAGVPQFQNLNQMDMDVIRELINQKLNEIDNKIKRFGEKVAENQNQVVQVTPITQGTTTN